MRHGAIAGVLLAMVAVVPAMQGSAAAQETDREREKRITVRTHGHAPHVMTWLRRGGQGQLGVAVEDVDAESASELGLDEARGARITDVTEDSPAAEAGLRTDDVIVRFDGERVRSVAELVRLVRETPPGREVRVRVIRDGNARTVTAEVSDRSRMDEARMERLRVRMERLRDRHGDEMERLREHMQDMDIEMESGDGMVMFRAWRGRMGVRLEGLTDQLAEYFQVDDRGGALVASVRDDSPASRAGIRAGDVIVSVGDEDVEGPREVARAVRDAEAGPVTVTVVRRGQERSFTVELPEREETSMLPAVPNVPGVPGVRGPSGPAQPAPVVRPPSPPNPVVPPRGPGSAPLAPGPVPAPPAVRATV